MVLVPPGSSLLLWAFLGVLSMCCANRCVNCCAARTANPATGGPIQRISICISNASPTKVLLKHGAQPNARTNTPAGVTALHLVLAGGVSTLSSANGQRPLAVPSTLSLIKSQRILDVAAAITRCGGRPAMRCQAGKSATDLLAGWPAFTR